MQHAGCPISRGKSWILSEMLLREARLAAHAEAVRSLQNVAEIKGSTGQVSGLHHGAMSPK